MKFAITFFCLVAVALAAPQDPRDVNAAILRDDRVDNGDGSFSYVFASDNGLEMEVRGVPGFEGQSNMEGSYLLPTGDGGFAIVTFIADENGFQPQSELLPVGPPAPAHVAELLRIAEEQRAQGITF